MRRLYAFMSVILILAAIQSGATQNVVLSEPPRIGLPGRSGILDGQTGESADLASLVARIKPGSILILGELHGEQVVRDQHMEILTALRRQNPTGVSVGMEFVDYIHQSFLDHYSAGDITEAEFLEAVKWKGFDFAFYRDQILFPQAEFAERVIGLNLPRAVSSQIARGGLASLSKEQSDLLPPNFTVGRDSYRVRFFEAMGMHPTPSLENYFVAQSSWDDTMAWKTVDFKLKNPDQIFVIIAGDFFTKLKKATEIIGELLPAPTTK